jgi:hypothetical protein
MDSEEQDIVVTGEVDTGPSAADYSRGRWDGSDVTETEIEWLYRSKRIPKDVACRIPRDERMPVPEPGEVVVFTAHFARGLGLPASNFFRSFLNFYELQQHHLPGNAIFHLSSIVSLCNSGRVCTTSRLILFRIRRCRFLSRSFSAARALWFLVRRART